MNPRQIERFFKELDRGLDLPCEIILTGAAAGALMGNVRPSLDIDFEITPKKRIGPAFKKKLEAAILSARQKSGVAAQYAGDISRWSMIDFLDYRQKAVPYKTVGRLRLRLISPEHWTLGKMARYLELDIQDMIRVIRKNKIPARRLTDLWARALKKSLLSPHLELFRRHVEDFLRGSGRRVWGKGFDHP